MQPGEIQLWRIVNTSARVQPILWPPRAWNGGNWPRTACSLRMSITEQREQAFLHGSGEPCGLAGEGAPVNQMSADIRVQNVMARSQVRATRRGPSC